MTITDAPLELPVKEHNRHGRSLKQCPLSYCDGAPSEWLMAAQCSGNRNCPTGGKLPSCWYAMGTTNTNMQQYYHFTNSEMSCIPCCNVRSRHSKMPGLIFSHKSFCYYCSNNYYVTLSLLISINDG